jgi:hypothetical protein
MSVGNLTPELFEAAGIPVTERKPVPAAVPAPVETDLDHIAARINTAFDAFEHITRNALRLALDIGDELIAAQGRVPKGEWESWREKNCPRVKARMTQIYVQLARQRVKIETALETAPDLSIRVARRLIAGNKSKQQRPRAPGPQEDKPEIPDWVVAYEEASDTDKADGIAHIITDLFTHMSAAARAQLTARVLGNAAENARTEKQRNAIRNAIREAPYIDGVPYSRNNRISATPAERSRHRSRSRQGEGSGAVNAGSPRD